MTTGEWLANCSACCVPEIAGALTRAARRYTTVTGMLLDRRSRLGRPRRVARCRACLATTYASRASASSDTRIPGMLDMYSDFTQVHAQTGAHVEVLEIDDLAARVESADDAAIARKDDEIREVFELADAGNDPIAGEITPDVFSWCGARRRRSRPAGRGLRARRAHLLLPRRRRQPRRADQLGLDHRQLSAHRTGRARRRRRRSQDERRDAAPRPARCRRFVHRVLRPRLRRGVHPDGARRPRPPRDRRTGDPSRARSGSTTARRAQGCQSR